LTPLSSLQGSSSAHSSASTSYCTQVGRGERGMGKGVAEGRRDEESRGWEGGVPGIKSQNGACVKSQRFSRDQSILASLPPPLPPAPPGGPTTHRCG
jgi:hypothetical protein